MRHALPLTLLACCFAGTAGAAVAAVAAGTESDADAALREKLETILVQDQALRNLIGPAQETFGEDSEEMRYFFDLMVREDRRNEEAVVAILDEQGWPGKSEVGQRANQAVWLVIQHAPLETQEKYLPLLERSVEAGESSAGDLALLQDRILMRKGEKQIYGSQIVREGNGAWVLHPVRDPETLNERRAAVGLGPIEEYLANWGLEFDPATAGGDRAGSEAPP